MSTGDPMTKRETKWSTLNKYSQFPKIIANGSYSGSVLVHGRVGAHAHPWFLQRFKHFKTKYVYQPIGEIYNRPFTLIINFVTVVICMWA